MTERSHSRRQASESRWLKKHATKRLPFTPPAGRHQATRRLRMSDRIEKVTVLKASRERVWRAISEAKQFGTWFGVDFDGEFKPGAHMIGKMRPTQVDAEVAKMQEQY